jgi:hypothetical protein
MDFPESHDIDSATDDWVKSPTHEPLIDLADQIETSTNQSYHPITPPPPPPPITTASTTSHIRETINPVVESLANQAKTEVKKGQQQAEDIISKTKRILKQHCKFNVLACP